MPCGRAQLHPFQKIGGQLLLGQFHPHFGRARPVRVGCRLDAAHPVAQRAPQIVDGKAERRPLWREVQDHLGLVIGQTVLQA